MNRFAVILLLGCTTLAGCTFAYKPPDPGRNVAKVRFFAPEVGSKGILSVSIYAFTDDKCSGTTKLRQLGGPNLVYSIPSKDTDIGMWKDPATNYDRNLYVEAPVVTDQRFNFAILVSYVNTSCNVTLSFLPQSDRQYEVKHFTQGRQCSATISEITSEGEKILMSKEPTAQRNSKACTHFWN